LDHNCYYKSACTNVLSTQKQLVTTRCSHNLSRYLKVDVLCHLTELLQLSHGLSSEAQLKVAPWLAKHALRTCQRVPCWPVWHLSI